MGHPAARIGDSHFCPAITSVKHKGGKITGKGIKSILIGGKKAAVLDDACSCIGRLNKIITASSNVYIGRRAAARVGDLSAHGGKITTGCSTVLIGSSLEVDLEDELSDRIQWVLQQEIYIETEKKFRLPYAIRRTTIINQVLLDAIGLLSNKLKLLRERDPETIEQFRKWFGKDDARSIEIIFQRIERQLKFIKGLNDKNFWNIKDEELRESEFAIIQQFGTVYIIYVGPLFWQAGRYGKDSKAGILIHELSHLGQIGNTKDHAYEKFGCLALASIMPGHSLENADSYEYFIES